MTKSEIMTIYRGFSGYRDDRSFTRDGRMWHVFKMEYGGVQTLIVLDPDGMYIGSDNDVSHFGFEERLPWEDWRTKGCVPWSEENKQQKKEG